MSGVRGFFGVECFVIESLEFMPLGCMLFGVGHLGLWGDSRVWNWFAACVGEAEGVYRMDVF